MHLKERSAKGLNGTMRFMMVWLLVYSNVLYYTILYYTILYCTVLYYTRLD